MNATLRARLDILVLLALTGGILALFAAIADREFRRPVAVATKPLATVTPTVESTSGWWATVPVTATPALAGLPGLPKISLSGGASGLQAGEPMAFSVVNCPRGDVKITAVTTAGKPGWWNIVGTAAIPNQEYWKGELSPNGQGWTMLYRSNAAIQDGLLIE